MLTQLINTINMILRESESEVAQSCPTLGHQASLSMEFSRQEYWSALPFPSPGDLAKPGIEPGSPALQADALPSEPPASLNIILPPRHFLDHFFNIYWLAVTYGTIFF